MAKIKVVHYINQFFAQIGGEEKADYPAEIRVGEVVGPGMALTASFKDDAEIIATIVCGDSYFNENLEKAKADILAMVKEQAPDVFIAGPAFNAGRYGVACATISAAVQEELGIPALTGMYVENPGADMFKNQVYMIATKNNAAGMRDAVSKMAPLALKLAKGEPIGASAEEGYMPNGIRVNFFEKERGSQRAVKMLLKKLNDKPFVTEYPMPDFDRVDPNPAVKDLAHAKIALVTSGGIVPKGNPDHIESSSASHYGEYDITGVYDLTEETYETAHGGYDPVYANKDSDRVLPVDVLRDLEKEGVIGELHNKFYTTTGNGTSVANSKAFAAEFSQKLLAAGVDAVILTST
ncbi:glycine reductase [Faecalicatena orotica]|jgi:betaine reductase|uniref:Glycine reductase n=2 Tax=Bacillota TaxID=1239 RepID=A0A2Y9BG79_9FIRM|nr:glycine reductase [Faecalicatena orotica]SSA55288.1 glycine reductase [Faecalicatena orotica]